MADSPVTGQTNPANGNEDVFAQLRKLAEISHQIEQHARMQASAYNFAQAGEIKVDEKGKYYTTGCQRTGCMFCGFGCHLEKYPNRFQRLAETHPKQYDYIINKLGFGEVLDFIGVEYKPNIDNKGQMKIF